MTDIQKVSDAMAARGYRWQLPSTLVPPARAGLFADHVTPSWIDPLLAPLSRARGGVQAVRWSITFRHWDAVPTAMTPTAQRVLSALWAGPRPLHVPVGDVAMALASAGVDSDGLAFVVSSSPAGAESLLGALGDLDIDARRIGSGGNTAAMMRSALLADGPHMSIEFPVGPPCGSNCRPGCRCGRYRVLAHLRFNPRSQPRSLLEIAVLESELLGAVQGTREPYGVHRCEALVQSVRDALPAKGGQAARAQRVRLVVDRLFTAALLIRSGFEPGPRGTAYVVRRLLRSVGTELALTGVPLIHLDSLMQVADGSVRTTLGLASLTGAMSALVREERERFAYLLARAPTLLRSRVIPSQRPAERAHALLQLRNEHGVPLGIAVEWCKQNDFAVSLWHVALLQELPKR
ncbi:alanine--tRNA ligase-related protein [Streptomyces sp. NPDC001822]|uniref:alanine--tRNA ligase-related protein n=1 Tax=Streptomyces sp. NPDC001822 TaxID=3364614 RepID=UPI0036956D85